jgi:hypothetical protein
MTADTLFSPVFDQSYLFFYKKRALKTDCLLGIIVQVSKIRDQRFAESDSNNTHSGFSCRYDVLRAVPVLNARIAALIASPLREFSAATRAMVQDWSDLDPTTRVAAF